MSELEKSQWLEGDSLTCDWQVDFWLTVLDLLLNPFFRPVEQQQTSESKQKAPNPPPKILVYL